MSATKRDLTGIHDTDTCDCQMCKWFAKPDPQDKWLEETVRRFARETPRGSEC